MRTLRFLPVCALAALAAAAPAQLVIGSTSTSANSGAFYYDIAAGTAKTLWTGTASGRKVNGITADAASGLLYNADSARLSKWAYGSPAGTLPTFISGFYRPTISGVPSAPTTTAGVSALSIARGGLYAYTNTASTGNYAAYSGIYLVDPTKVGSSSVSNMSVVWKQTDNLQYNLTGLAYDAAAGLMYATNTPTKDINGNPLPSTPTGLYSIDLFAATQTVTKIADFDASFLTVPDGLAIGGGKLWLSGKISGDTALSIESYDLTTRTYGDLTSFAFGDANNFSTDLVWAPGAAPVPEPASFAVLALGAAAMLRRRRRK